MFYIWQFNLVGTTNDVFKRINIKISIKTARVSRLSVSYDYAEIVH